MTIRDNLLWGSESATDKEIAHACRQANAIEFIERLPKGFDTIVGDRGVRLSGGQVQRVALARAILRRPCLFILDEATSSLDTYSEKLIQRSIEMIAKETTTVIIAHRLSTIMNADYVYVIKKGRIIEEGAYSDLVTMNGQFNRMVKLQILETAQKGENVC
jgi:ABC-type multidrug transport system fused ATPase/permease subunit